MARMLDSFQILSKWGQCCLASLSCSKASTHYRIPMSQTPIWDGAPFDELSEWKYFSVNLLNLVCLLCHSHNKPWAPRTKLNRNTKNGNTCRKILHAIRLQISLRSRSMHAHTYMNKNGECFQMPHLQQSLCFQNIKLTGGINST